MISKEKALEIAVLSSGFTWKIWFQLSCSNVLHDALFDFVPMISNVFPECRLRVCCAFPISFLILFWLIWFRFQEIALEKLLSGQPVTEVKAWAQAGPG